METDTNVQSVNSDDSFITRFLIAGYKHVVLPWRRFSWRFGYRLYLLSINDEKLDQKVYDYFEGRIPAVEFGLVAIDKTTSISIGGRAILLTRTFEEQVKNGGIGQFFFNYPRSVWMETKAALKFFGHDQLVALITEAIHFFETNEARVNPSSGTNEIEWRDFAEIFGYVPLNINCNDLSIRLLRALETLPGTRVQKIRAGAQEFI